MKRNDPAKVFTCVSCKRIRAKSLREAGRNRCRDRKDCAKATADWFAKEEFVNGVAARP